MDLSFGAAIMVGLLGSSHCIGMCGGIVAALNMGISEEAGKKPSSLLLYHIGYNAGRIVSYVLVGLLAGSLGASLVSLGLNPATGKLFAAAFMVALGLYLANWWRGLVWLERLGAHLWRHIQPLGQKLFPIKNPLQAFMLGLLWGWLPCGLVYTVVAWSLTTGGALEGARLMLGFGIGTLPALLIAGSALNYFRDWVRSPLLRTSAGLMVIAFGLYSGFTGLTGPQQPHHAVLAPATLSQPESVSMRTPAILRSVS